MSKVYAPRVCWHCNDLYPPTGPNQKYCPDCLPKMQVIWHRDKRAANPELYNAIDRATRQRNIEKIRAHDKERNAVRRSDPEWLARFQVKNCEAAKARRAADPEKYRAYHAARRLKGKGQSTP